MEQENFFLGWGTKMLSCLSECCDSDACQNIMHSCAEYHYQQNNMDDLLDKYTNNLNGFILFLSGQWGWKVEYNEDENMIIADENKDCCVCPITKQIGKEHTSSTLCYCSEGFAERMFSKVIGKPVKAHVVKSILRGDSSCVYEIHIFD